MLPTLLTTLTLAKCPPNTAYHPYAWGVHSQHSRNTTYPYACVVPSQCAPNTTYPYGCVVPSQHAPNTAYHPYCPPNTAYHPYTCGVPSQHALSLRLCSSLPTCSQHCLPPLRSRSALRHAPNTTYPYACVVPSPHYLPSLRLRSALPTPLILRLV
ncbi:hypothetical protein O181_125140 [Austropuccinia psidii MF-1]|uniref:Uncharacterized protein n=1 Tax=Austropuccinia psidii MF-1 TaxID=1389203 RepID=A0A9Q3Q5U0_9BASI|nr:hypothetical protein [Austropuccinia psidii MF-1]